MINWFIFLGLLLSADMLSFALYGREAFGPGGTSA